MRPSCKNGRVLVLFFCTWIQTEFFSYLLNRDPLAVRTALSQKLDQFFVARGSFYFFSKVLTVTNMECLPIDN